MPGGRVSLEALRRAGRILGSPPWRRAPFQALRSPSLAMGIAVAAFVLGLAGASRPLFAASAGAASLGQDLEQGCAFEMGMRVQRGVQLQPGSDAVAEGAALLDRAVAGVEGIEPAVVTTFAGVASIGGQAGGDGGTSVQLIERVGFRQHIEVVRGGEGTGLWLPDVVADPLGLAVGDEVSLGVLGGDPLVLPLAGTYRDLRPARGVWWCSMRYAFEARTAGGSPPPPVALVDGEPLAAQLADLGVRNVDAWWEHPPRAADWDLDTARRATRQLRVVADRTNDRISELSEVLGPGTSAVDLPASVAKASSAREAVASVAAPVAWGAIGVALTMLLTAARSWLSRRSQQVTLLSLRGAGPLLLGAKAVGELLPGLLVGGGLGIGAALLVQRHVAPDPSVDAAALADGLAIVALAAALAVLVVGVVVASGASRVGIGVGGATPRRTLLPWEPVVLAVAAAALYEVHARPEAGSGVQLDGLLLVFPLLLLAGGAGAAARLLLSRRLVAGIARRAPGSVWLAARRLAAGRARVSLIVTGAAISIGIVVFAGATSSSVQATALAKSTLGDGAAQIVRLSANEPIPASLPLPGGTLVNRTAEPSVVRAGHDRADVLGVDPATFEDAAFWDRTFSTRSLSSLLDAIALGGDGGGGVVPGIAVGTGLPSELVLGLDGPDGVVELPVRVVGRADFFPGYQQTSDRPLVVVDRAALLELGVVGFPEVWTADEDPRVPEAVVAAGGTVVFSHRAADDLDTMVLRPQVWAIDYLEVIGAAAGLVTVAGLGLHFAADAERRRLGAALARRLGVPGRQVGGATLVEVTAILGAGLLLGVGLAWLALRLVFRRLDPIPSTPPDPLLRYDLPLVGWCALAVVVVAVVVTFAVARPSRRTSLPELLRAAR